MSVFEALIDQMNESIDSNMREPEKHLAIAQAQVQAICCVGVELSRIATALEKLGDRDDADFPF